MEDEGKEPDKVLWESGSSQPCEMANMPGFRFQPTEEELVGFYLRSMVVGHRQEVELINVLDLYRYDPWELPAMAFMQGEREWLFFCPRDKKYPNGVRPNRVTASGYWKATGTDRPVRRSKDSRCIGLKKTLVFYTGKAPKGCKTEWIMNEYRLPQNDQSSICSLPNLRKPSCSKVQKEVALCRIYKKSGHSNILPTTTTMTSDPDYCVPLDDHCTSPSTVPTLHHRKTNCSSSSNELEGSLHSSTTDALLRRVLRDQLSACMAARSDHMTMQAAVSVTCCNDPFSPNSKHSVLEDMEEILEFGTRKLDDCTNSIHYHPAHQQALGNIAAGHPHPNYRNSLSPPNRLSDPIICNNRSSMVKLETGDLSSMLYSVNPAKELTADSIISTTVPVSPFTNYTVPDHGEAVIASLDQSFVIKSSAHVDVSSCVSASQMNNSLQGIEIAIPDQAQVSWFRPEHVQYPQGHGSIFGDSSSLQPATCLHPSSASLVTLSSIDRLLKASMWSHI